MTLIHGTAVAIDGKAVVLRGPPGAGKSDLALRLIGAGAVLVADDQIELSVEGAFLLAAPPPAIAGLLELRGVGIRRLPHLARAPVALVVDLTAPDAVERLPEPRRIEVEGVAVPTLALAPFEASAAAKIGWALCPDAEAMPVAGGAGALRYNADAMHLPSSPPRIPDPRDATAEPRVVLITGISGAGRSTALKLLEDLGYEAVDNLPLSLLPRLVGTCDRRAGPVAVGIDVRTRDFCAGAVADEIAKLTAEESLDCRLVFLDCDDEVLARRYTETRRRHPLAGDRPVMDGIRLERSLVSPLRRRADLVIDTSVLRIGELKRLLAGHFGATARSGLKIFVTSFSFKEGLPREADLVFDVRFLENPHYHAELRPLTGLDPAVAAFVSADPSWDSFFAGLTALLRPLLPRYDSEGKAYLTIAIGCTGGRHRSVHAAERLGAWLAAEGQAVAVAHRDIERPPPPPARDSAP